MLASRSRRCSRRISHSRINCLRLRTSPRLTSRSAQSTTSRLRHPSGRWPDRRPRLLAISFRQIATWKPHAAPAPAAAPVPAAAPAPTSPARTRRRSKALTRAGRPFQALAAGHSRWPGRDRPRADRPGHRRGRGRAPRDRGSCPRRRVCDPGRLPRGRPSHAREQPPPADDIAGRRRGGCGRRCRRRR